MEAAQENLQQQAQEQSSNLQLDGLFFSDMGWAFDDNFFQSDFSLGPTSNYEQFGLNGFTAPTPLKASSGMGET